LLALTLASRLAARRQILPPPLAMLTRRVTLLVVA
jgi:hypothetical protein